MSTPLFTQPDQGQHWGGNKDISRDRWGRPLVTPPDGGKPTGYTRCTTFVDALSDKSNLMAWKARMAAIGLAQRDDLLIQVAQHDPEDKKGLDRLVNQAADIAGASRSADIGTQLHEAAEKHDQGLPVGPLGKFQADLDAYITATADIRWTAFEQFRVHDDLKIGGTADRVAVINGQSVIADIKTGGLYDVGKMAMQMAVYARSKIYDLGTGHRSEDTPPMNLDMALLIHLPQGTGTCELYWLNLSAGWDAVLLAKRVREWRKFHNNKTTRGQVITPADPTSLRP